MAVLADAGVVDTGMAVVRAGQQEGHHRSMKVLLDKQSGRMAAGGAAHADNRRPSPRLYTPFLSSASRPVPAVFSPDRCSSHQHHQGRGCVQPRAASDQCHDRGLLFGPQVARW